MRAMLWAGMRAYLGPLFLALAGWLGLHGCGSSGQTGSPSCAGWTSCICGPLYGYATLLRVQVESFESGRLEATVQEAFTSAEAAPSDFGDGDLVEGTLHAEQPCDHDAPSAVEPGVELLVLYSAGTDGDDGAFSWAVPWQETLDFGASHQLSTSDIDVLTSVDACLERFPSPPPEPCNDVVMDETESRCTAAPRGTDSPGEGPGSLLVVTLALTWALRRASFGRAHSSLIHD